jgi:tetratricopeptide (TPR) repeat protein
MRRRQQKVSPLPAGWLEEFQNKADLQRSYAALQGGEHFYVEAFRGNIKTQQLEFGKAWEHFDRAHEKSAEAEETVPNLVRQFLLNIWCFECALLEAPLAESRGKVPPLWLPEVPEEVLQDYPEVQLVMDYRLQSEGILRLHLGECEESAAIFESLISRGKGPGEPQVAIYYLGLAACQFNLGEDNEARRNLENAGFAVLTGSRTINQAQSAGLLHGLYSYMHDHEHVRDWAVFIQSLNCPQATKDLSLRRGLVVMERCSAHSGLLVL